MMEIHAFPASGNWYKGNLHCHSTNSDGRLTPQDVAELYRSHGYSFLAISDHDLYSDYRAELDRDGFVILPAVEASAVLYRDERKDKAERLAVHHIHGILGTEEMADSAECGTYRHLEKIPPKEFCGSWDGAAAAQEMTDDLLAHGCFAVYNHPVWSRVREEDFIHTKGLTAIEIYNYGTVIESGTGFDSLRWDVMLREGTRIFATASDDNHNDESLPDSFGGYIVVKADRPDHESIVKAILNGSYYSSSGPEIYDFGIQDGKVYVSCSPVCTVNFIAGSLINAGGSVLAEDGRDTLTDAQLMLKGNESYVRAECIDCHGKTAWTNPIFLHAGEMPAI